jgi:hypothetical protein
MIFTCLIRCDGAGERGGPAPCDFHVNSAENADHVISREKLLLKIKTKRDSCLDLERNIFEQIFVFHLVIQYLFKM